MTRIPCGASQCHDTTERVQLYRHSIDLTRDRPLLLALSVLALDRLRTAVYYIDNRPLKSADTCTAGWCSWTPWNTQSLNEHFARSTSARGSLHLLCAASRDTVDLSCVEANAERSCCSPKGERHRAVFRENVLPTCRGRSNTPTEHCMHQIDAQGFGPVVAFAAGQVCSGEKHASSCCCESLRC